MPDVQQMTDEDQMREPCGICGSTGRCLKTNDRGMCLVEVNLLKIERAFNDMEDDVA